MALTNRVHEASGDDVFGPVLSWDGRRIWRVQVAHGEMTCTSCGDVFRAGGYCTRCATFARGNRSMEAPEAVPTLSYLRDGEWERR